MFNNFQNNVFATWHPDCYHGWGKTRRYFEGWYFKIVNQDESEAYAVIPGISMGPDGASYSFIQVMDGKRCKAHFFRFLASDFQPSADKFEIRIGNNYFSASEMRLDLPGFKGTIQIENTNLWPKMLGAPGIMGWYSFVPFMECFHGVVSLHHKLSGSLEVETRPGHPIDFSGGVGYIEKDWGRSFPRAYVWMQSNHFDTNPQASLMASVAHIPWLNSYFIGFISGFWLEGRLFRFATYTGAKKRLAIDGENVELIFKSPGLELRIHATQAVGTALLSPISGEMAGKINESLQAHFQVELLEKGVRIFEGSSRTSGLELAGDIPVLLNPKS